MNATQEQWLPVAGFEGIYEVSDHGRVRSLDRIVKSCSGRKRRAPGRVLKPWMSAAGGHLKIKLKTEHLSRKEFIHTLVLEAFVGPRPEGMVCCHADGNATNNNISNLRWDSYSANNHELVTHGTHWNTRKTHCPQGHPYDAENTRTYTHRGWKLRYCRECQRRRHREKRNKGVQPSRSQEPMSA